jgi:AraC-like DNA-binding protein
LGSGYFRCIQLGDDLMLAITELHLSRPLIMHYENYDNQFETTYCLQGYIGYAETGVVDTGLSQNEFGIYIKPQSCGMVMYPSDKRIFAVSILVKGRLLDSLPQYKACVTCGDCRYKNVVNHLMNPRKSGIQLHNWFSQMISNYDENDLQALLMEGLAKTIVASMWHNHVVLALDGTPCSRYSEADRRAFRAAAEILEREYAAPPTIPELSRMVGVNEFKLKNGFRELYGRTVYGYVQKQRMAVAKSLLENEDLTITQIAGMVGYINASHFAEAFRRQNHVNPSELRNRV